MTIIYGYLPPGSRTKPKKAQFVPMKPTQPLRPIRDGADQASSLRSIGSGIGNATIPKRDRYDEDEELAIREAAARQRQHLVAPICNKGGYQLITGDDIKTAGRKV